MGKTAKKRARQAEKTHNNNTKKPNDRFGVNALPSLASKLNSNPINAVVNSNNNDDDNISIDSDDDESISPSSHDIEITMNTLLYLQENPQDLLSKEYKKLRSILYQLHNAKGQTPSGRISDALRDGRFDEANMALNEMRKRNQIPKLGALQRWVRDCDATSDISVRPTAETLKTLDLILRTADPALVMQIHGKEALSVEPEYPLRYYPDWHPYINNVPHTNQPPFIINDEYKSKFSIVHRDKAKDRKPENLYDMILYHSQLNTIDTTQYSLQVTRIDVPKLPGAFVLKNVLSEYECHQIISAAETIGFTPDVPKAGSAKDSQSILAHNFFWLADDAFLNTIYSRCKAFLPHQESLGGLNARWRVYRYQPGSVYRPHIDGAWPGSGLRNKTISDDGIASSNNNSSSKHTNGTSALSAHGSNNNSITNGQHQQQQEYVYDIYGDRMSKLTFLIRLNHNFKGGSTTFFTPSIQEGILDARPICPFQGDVLVFSHGDTEGSLLHEGSAVMATNGKYYDAKYVIRTEVLYLK